MTNEDVHNAANTFLKAVDAAPTGTGTVLKDHASKDWMETSVLRALSKLDAAFYHCSNVARLVQSAHEKAKTRAGLVEYPTKTKLKPTAMSVAGTFVVQKIAFEIDAFLAAARASIDFGGAVLALHLGMHGRTSITRVLESLEKAPKSPFAFLLAWSPWIEVLKKYRDECVHYRALRIQTGYEAVHRKGVLTVAILPFVIPQEIGHDQPENNSAAESVSHCGPKPKRPYTVPLCRDTAIYHFRTPSTPSGPASATTQPATIYLPVVLPVPVM